jgi:hypothetical protein
MAAVVILMGSGNVGVTVLERNEFAKLEVRHAGITVAADDWQRCGRLYFDQVLERAGELSAEGVGAGVVMESRESGLGFHRDSPECEMANAAKSDLQNQY